MRGILPCGSNRKRSAGADRPRCDHRRPPLTAEEPAMCFDLDSRPPIAPIAGGALDGRLSRAPARDGNAFAAFRARPAEPERGRRSWSSRTSAASIRSTRSSPFGSPSAASTRSRSTSSGGPRGADARGDAFEHMPHVERTTWAGISADIAAGVATALGADGERIDRGLHDRLLHGWPDVVPRLDARSRTSPASSGCTGRSRVRGGTTRPRRSTWSTTIAAPVLGLFGGADQGITAEAIARLRRGLATSGPSSTGSSPTRARRTASSTARPSTTRAESEAAWNEVIAFIGAHRDATA